MNEPLSSKWDGLSSHLLASFWEVDRNGKRVDPNVTVKAPLTDNPNLDITLGWQSPFENVGQSTFPTLQQMLQSGGIQPGVGLAQKFGETIGDALSGAAAAVEGKSSITKLNSIQVFQGMPPVKFTVTAVFRAWSDPQKEVEDPVNQLIKWALPVHLEGDSILLSRLVAQGVSFDTFLPSTVPVFIAMKYKGKVYKPLVIESIGDPIGSPIDSKGKFTEKSIPMTLATLTAIDRGDWANYHNYPVQG